ncbi:MAG: hypothetical protein KDI79_20530 [Anaerolineae bacterium]|nr:hypothetical protein [Anaerolineae bacterium]
MGTFTNKITLKIALQFVILLGCLLFLQPQPINYAQDFPDVCQQNENILRNCNFDQGFDHWQSFIETGGADFNVLQGGGECHAPLCPAGYIVTADHFIGGILQQVPVEKGRNYYANIVWLVFDSLSNDASINKATGGIGRRIGIDPTGGTDSRSSNVVWSEDNWRNDCKICNVEHVTVTAQADTITVFLRIDDTWKVRAAEKGYPVPPSNDKFWIDDLGLKPVGGDPIAVVVEETPTEEPTEEPTPVPPTETPAPTEEPARVAVQALTQVEATEEAESDLEEVEAEASLEAASDPIEESTTEPTEESTGEPTDEPDTPTPPATDTPIPPPPTLTPTNTPPPTATARPRPSPTPRPTGESGSISAGDDGPSNLPVMLSTVGTLGCVGGLGLSFAGAVMAGLVWLYRLGWGQKEEEADFEYKQDEVEAYNDEEYDEAEYYDDDGDEYYDENEYYDDDELEE